MTGSGARRSACRVHRNDDRRPAGTSPRPTQRGPDRLTLAGASLDQVRAAYVEQFRGEVLRLDQLLVGALVVTGHRRPGQVPRSGGRPHHSARQPAARHDHTAGVPVRDALLGLLGVAELRSRPHRDELLERHAKVAHRDALGIYRSMRRGIVTRPERVTVDNVTDILDADFVFLTMDPSLDKRAIVEALIAADVPFVDTGIGVSNDPNGIAGQIRVTSATPGQSQHIERDSLISYFVGDDDDDDYNTNLQISELNSMAAILAVMRFKKHYGFYADVEGERHSVYATDANEFHNRYGDTDYQRAEFNQATISPAKDVA